MACVAKETHYCILQVEFPKRGRAHALEHHFAAAQPKGDKDTKNQGGVITWLEQNLPAEWTQQSMPLAGTKPTDTRDLVPVPPLDGFRAGLAIRHLSQCRRSQLQSSAPCLPHLETGKPGWWVKGCERGITGQMEGWGYDIPPGTANCEPVGLLPPAWWLHAAGDWHCCQIGCSEDVLIPCSRCCVTAGQL